MNGAMCPKEAKAEQNDAAELASVVSRMANQSRQPADLGRSSSESLMTQVQKEYPAGSIHSANGWEGQLARVSRWLNRLMNAGSPADAEDFLYAFFQNAHHLRDWAAGGKTTAHIDTFLNSHLATRICRDVANVTKHHELTRRPAQEYEPSILREYAGKHHGWFEDDSRLVVVTNHNNDGIVLDAREVAKECLRLWCEFLSPCDICDSIVSHFHFSATAFGRVMAEAEGWTSWAKQVMREREDDEQSHAPEPAAEPVSDGESSPPAR